jgi:hypothetical protein
LIDVCLGVGSVIVRAWILVTPKEKVLVPSRLKSIAWSILLLFKSAWNLIAANPNCVIDVLLTLKSITGAIKELKVARFRLNVEG